MHGEGLVVYCVHVIMVMDIVRLTGGMASIIRHVLDGFHSHKKERGVDEMLVKLYEPILWRALKVCFAFVVLVVEAID